MSIEILPARLANQIAAGEVVERPASVVKELIENSLDAGATRIQVDIERGGHKLIRIRDNGSGIGKDDLTLALSRHATSKLKSLDDLENICSLGFRGEALASISSVSRLTLSSKPQHQETAWQAFAEGRDMAVQVKPTAHPDGTTIEVKDLFFNTPARRKFLRTEKTEFSHIDELLKRIALSRFDVSMTLTHNGKVVRQFRAQTDPSRAITRVGQVAGKVFTEQGAYIESGEAGLMLRGWVLPVGSKNTTQYTYVNNRMMRDKLILHAIRQAFEEVAGAEELPGFVIYIDIDPRQVDVNVHPAKHEVRFHQGRLVHDFILQAVKQVVLPMQGDVFQPQPNQAGIAKPLYEQQNQVTADVFDYPKSSLQSAEQRVTASGGGYSARDRQSAERPKAKTSHHDINAFYQGVSEQHAAHFDMASTEPNIAHTSATMAPSEHNLLINSDGSCMFIAEQQWYCSHIKYLLADDWLSQTQSDGHLEGKALLLPVRVSLSKLDCQHLIEQQSWFTLLGFDLVIDKQFVMVKKLPQSLYLNDVSVAINELVKACEDKLTTLIDWLNWQQKQVPERYFTSQAFAEQRLRIENNPQTVQRLLEKAVKIDVINYLEQLDQGS